MTWWMDTAWDDDCDSAPEKPTADTFCLVLTKDQAAIVHNALRVAHHEGALSRNEVTPILDKIESLFDV